MDSHASEVWKTRALDAENALQVALIELTASRGKELVLRAKLAHAQENTRAFEECLRESDAAIARVRELCEPVLSSETESTDVPRAEIRAALGDTQ